MRCHQVQGGDGESNDVKFGPDVRRRQKKPRCDRDCDIEAKGEQNVDNVLDHGFCVKSR